MSVPMFLAYVASALIFGAIFLVGVLVYGGEISRSCALGAALFACFSQFIGQDAARDARIWRPRSMRPISALRWHFWH